MAISASLDGRWKGTLKTPDGNDIQAVYNFKVDGNVLTGTAESTNAAVTRQWKSCRRYFLFFGNAYLHKGKMYDDSCGVDVNFGGGQMMHETLVRDTTK